MGQGLLRRTLIVLSSSFKTEIYFGSDDEGMSWEIATVITLVGIVGFVSFFAKNIDQNHWYIKILLFLVGFFFCIVTVSLGRIIASENGASDSVLKIVDTAYSSLVWLTMFVVFYVLIYFIIKAVYYFNLPNKKPGEGDEIEDLV